jgi:hypothetical protein
MLLTIITAALIIAKNQKYLITFDKDIVLFLKRNVVKAHQFYFASST